jgi:2-dehydropantoate 2-reductase
MGGASVTAAVIGGGAMGAALAAEATRAGQDVTVVDVVPEVVNRINNDGVVVETAGHSLNVNVRATSDPASVGHVDLAVIFVKCHDTAAAAQAAKELMGPHTTVVTLQNGWGNADVLASVLAPDQLVMGVTYHSCSSIAPGHVRHTGRGPTVVGPYQVDGDLSQASRTADFLSTAGWEAQATTDVRTDIWKKLVLNAATLPSAALTRLPASDLRSLRELVDALAAEAVDVAKALGLDIEIEERIARIHEVLIGAGSGKPSMLQDVEAKRLTEVDAINGAVVRLGGELGVATPLNQAMVSLVHGLERSW